MVQFAVDIDPSPRVAVVRAGGPRLVLRHAAELPEFCGEFDGAKRWGDPCPKQRPPGEDDPKKAKRDMVKHGETYWNLRDISLTMMKHENFSFAW